MEKERELSLALRTLAERRGQRRVASSNNVAVL